MNYRDVEKYSNEWLSTVTHADIARNPDPLLTDRTAQDTENASDLNRVEFATAYLRDRLTEYGYRVSVTVKTDWTRTDTPNTAEINRIRANINALQDGFYSLPDWREIVVNNTLDFEQANALEWNLHAIGVWVERMVGAFWISGELISGEV